MKKTFTILKKLFFYLLGSTLILLSALVIVVFLYGDQIKNQIIKNLNTQIETPIKVNAIELEIFEHFPFLTIDMQNVIVQESIENSSRSLLEAASVHLLLNPFNLLKKDYTINSVQVNDGFIRLQIDRYGRENYLIISSTGSNSTSSSSFDINKITLNNVDFEWKNILSQQDIKLYTSNMTASLKKKASAYQIEHEGFAEIEYLTVGNYNYVDYKKVWSAAQIIYTPDNNKISISNGALSIMDSDFIVNGTYDLSDLGDIDFKIEGKETDIQNLISLLPEKVQTELTKYQSHGNVYFDIIFGGKLNADSSPTLTAHFGFKNAEITHPESSKKITEAWFEGWFVSNSMIDLESAELTIKDFSGKLDSYPFLANLSVKNFNDKQLSFSFKSEIPVESLLNFYPNNYLSGGTGIINIDLKFEGKLTDLKTRSAINKITSSGQIGLHEVNLELPELQQNLSDLNGELVFNNHNVAMNDFRGYIGKSHFELNGLVGNIFSWLLLNDEHIRLDAKMYSQFLDIDELLSIGNVEESHDKQYSLNISPMIFLTFDCQVDKVQFRRFDGRNISGILKIRDQLAMLQNIRFSEAGGEVQLEGLVDTKGEMIEIMTQIKMTDINLDSMFYVFENFNQDFLRYEHLSGKMSSEVTSELRLTKNLEFIPQSLLADMAVIIKDGELKNFEPMQLLADYLPADNLKHLTFSELKNDIHVENQMIYLPEMQINSNVTNIKIGGTHTFDQHINYKIVAPLFNKPRVDPDEVFGAIEDDGASVPKIHLLLTGTTDDYYIKLDKAGMKNQLVNNLKQEVIELKEAFKQKRDEKKKTLELKEDEYIEWEY